MTNKITNSEMDENLEKIDFSYPLSIKNISNQFNNLYSKDKSKKVKRDYIIYYLCKSNKYRRVDPIELSSNKHKVSVWTKI